jgi:thioredoxin-related protein
MAIRRCFHIFTLLLPALSILSNASQAQGIRFEKLNSWQEVVQQARSSGKPIFVDAYTTWCGPCILMAKNVFTDPEVGAFFNPNYISIKVQLDSTTRDNAYVQSWYADAAMLAGQYNINAYPTLLFFDADGNIVHKVLGFQSAAQLVAKAKEAMDPARQYYTLLRQYTAGNRSESFLKNWIEAARNAHDPGHAQRATYDYLKTQSNWLTTENAALVAEVTLSSSDTGFVLMSRYPDSFNTAAKIPLFAQDKVRKFIQKEWINPILFPENMPVEAEPDWDALLQHALQKYPEQGEAALWLSRVFYYEITGNQAAYMRTLTHMVQKMPSQWQPVWLNEHAWKVYQEAESAAMLTEALAWATQAVEQEPDPMYIDTLAQLLYATGQKEQAIAWMQKAIALLQEAGEDAEEYEETLQKMQQGEKIK